MKTNVRRYLSNAGEPDNNPRPKRTVRYSEDNFPMWTPNNVNGYYIDTRPRFGNMREPIPTYDEFRQRLRDRGDIFDGYNPNYKGATTVNAETTRTEGQRAKDFVLNYIGSPGYMSRTNLDEAGVRRLKNRIAKTRIEYDDASIKNAVYRPRNNRVDVYAGLDPTKYGGLRYAIGHELGHAADVGQRNDTFKQHFSGLNSHDSRNTERYADLMAFRQFLYESGIYDSNGTEPFTEDHLNRAVRIGYWNDVDMNEDYFKTKFPNWRNIKNGYMMNRILRQMRPEALIEMMNTIAQNYDDNKINNIV